VLEVVHRENETNKHALAAVGGSLLDELVRDGARVSSTWVGHIDLEVSVC
jgi:hypothetical protein